MLSHSTVSYSFGIFWIVAWQAPLWDFPDKNTGVGAFSFSRKSSQTRDQTHIFCVSCIAGRFFTHWATGEALMLV